jgi:hypothetical protein
MVVAAAISARGALLQQGWRLPTRSGNGASRPRWWQCKEEEKGGSSPAYRSGENRAARELGAGEEKNGGEEGLHLL